MSDSYQSPVVPKKSSRLRNIFLAAAFGLGFAGVYYDAAVHRDPGPSSGVVESERGIVHSQTVRTFFESSDYHDDTRVSVRGYPWQKQVVTETIEGRFPASEAYRFNVVKMDFNSRDKNKLISFTAPTDLLAGFTGAYDEPSLTVPADARRVPLSELSAEERDRLRAAYESLGDRRGRQSIPAGLVDPAQYLKPGVDGYSFQVWDDISNGVGGNRYFRDVAGVYDENETIPGRKMITEIAIRAEGKFCRIKGEANEYELQPKTNGPNCERIDTMKPDRLAEIKAQAAVFGIRLVDETIHTYVRDAKGNILAQDVTKTLIPGPVNLTEQSWKFDQERVSTGGAIDTYVFLDLDAGGRRVANVIGTSFPKGTLPEGQVPEVKRTAEHERGSASDPGRTVWTIAGRKTLADNDPTGYEIKYIDGRFAAHGKPSHLPRNQRNQWGA